MNRIEAKLDFLILCLMDSGELSPAMQSKAHDLLFGDYAKESDVDKLIRDELLAIGMPCNFRGFQFCVDAIRINVEQPDETRTAAKLYAMVAELTHEEPRKVERAIRHAVESTMTHGNDEAVYKIFGATIRPDKAKPTNFQFIKRMALHISDLL